MNANGHECSSVLRLGGTGALEDDLANELREKVTVSQLPGNPKAFTDETVHIFHLLEPALGPRAQKVRKIELMG